MRVLIFIGLKITEILAICAIIVLSYSLGLMYSYFGILPPINTLTDQILACFLGIAVTAIAILIPVGLALGIYNGIKKNWEWAGNIAKTKKRDK